jgi:hypothetical protein
MLRDAYLSQLVKHPTRSRGSNEPSILDLVLTSNEKCIPNINYLSPLCKSDHCILLFDYVHIIKLKPYSKKKIFYDKGDYEQIKINLQSTNWEDLLRDKDVETQWKIFEARIKELEATFIPSKTINMNQKRGEFPLPYNVVKKIRKKHNLWKRYMETREGKIYEEYCRTRNKVKSLICKVRREHERKISKQVKTNPKRFWQYIKSKSNTKEPISELYSNPHDPSSETIEDDQRKANILNDFFSSVFTREPNGKLPEFGQYTIEYSMTELEITEEIICTLLKRLNPNKSCGPDGVHPRFLKELGSELAKPLAILFQTSVTNMQVPNCWKDARITAIFKKGNRKAATNYRPVSLTSIVCKVLEQLIRDHIMKHMFRNKLFSNKQFGFINGRATSLQLMHVLNEWTEALEQNNYVDCIYMDFQKAFDTVPHNRLLQKLDAYGINEQTKGWIRNFLSNRRQQVGINEKTSGWKDVISGIPQGSVIGPILFVLYINDMPSTLTSPCYLFADDTKLYRTIKDDSSIHKLQQDLDTLGKWSEKWLLKFHPTKCISMSIGNKTKPGYNYKLNIVNEEHSLQWVQEEKDIGVIIDDNLNFDTHINTKINKANSILGLIRRSYKYLDNETFIPLYKAMVRTQFDYASIIWNPYTAKHRDAIEGVQRRATKQLPNMSTLEYCDRLRKLGLPTLAYRRHRGDMIEAYKIMSNKYDEAVCKNVFAMRDNTQRPGLRGHNYTIIHERNKNAKRKHFFTQRIINTWNSLPHNLVNAPSLNIFKNSLDRLWSKQDILYDYKASLNYIDYVK